VLLGIGLVVDPVGRLLERPFARLSSTPRVGAGTSSGVLLGAGLGLVFAPCAGPIFAAIAAAGSKQRISWSAVALTAAYALGVAVPLLAIALGSQRLSTHWAALRTHAQGVRRASGVFILAMAALVATGAATTLATEVPSYASTVLVGPSIRAQLQRIDGEHANRFADAQKKDLASAIPNLGPAPDFTGITSWLNTPGNRPLTLAQLRGKVVLVDFWTYSCINCRRSLPHVEAWYRAYHKDGLVVVGVHTPEFAFEHDVGNVAAATGSLGVRYPVAIDNSYGTWDAYNNQYWPAEYLIDQNGDVRHTAFGEGDYATTESDIRMLLLAGGAHHLPRATDVPNTVPTVPVTPESYLGYSRLNNAMNSITDDAMTSYQLPSSVPLGALAFGGRWAVHQEEATAGPGAVLQLHFEAHDVYLVLGGHGTVRVTLPGTAPMTVHVKGYPDLYTMVASRALTSGTVTLHVSRGVRAYDFTFG
jgi:thiol-disulfide isomerase/thioredoxin